MTSPQRQKKTPQEESTLHAEPKFNGNTSDQRGDNEHNTRDQKEIDRSQSFTSGRETHSSGSLVHTSTKQEGKHAPLFYKQTEATPSSSASTCRNVWCMCAHPSIGFWSTKRIARAFSTLVKRLVFGVSKNEDIYYLLAIFSL